MIIAHPSGGIYQPNGSSSSSSRSFSSNICVDGKLSFFFGTRIAGAETTCSPSHNRPHGALVAGDGALGAGGVCVAVADGCSAARARVLSRCAAEGVFVNPAGAAVRLFAGCIGAASGFEAVAGVVGGGGMALFSAAFA